MANDEDTRIKDPTKKHETKAFLAAFHIFFFFFITSMLRETKLSSREKP